MQAGVGLLSVFLDKMIMNYKQIGLQNGRVTHQGLRKGLTVLEALKGFLTNFALVFVLGTPAILDKLKQYLMGWNWNEFIQIRV